MSSNFPFIPDLDRLFETFVEVVDNPCYGDMDSDPYFSYLHAEGFVAPKSGFIVSTGKFDVSDRELMRRSFWEVISEFQIVTDITDLIEASAMKAEEIVTALEDRYQSNEILVYLAWLERLNIIKIKDGKYQIVDEVATDADDMEHSDSIYPFSYNSGPIDISEEKYSAYEYLRRLNRGDIKMYPEFQRNIVWNQVQKSRFIESLLLQLPIPQLYLKRDTGGKLVVIDGLQRTTAIADFISNKFTLSGLNALSELNGKSFSDLQEDGRLSGLATRIEDKQLFFYVLGPSVPMRVVYDIFNRINTGGTKLERQEVRNCVFIGNATRLLKEISESLVFRKSIENGVSSKRRKDREAILRCIAFALTPYIEYQGSLDELLEMTMKKLNFMSSVEIEDLKRRTLDTFEKTYQIFGNRNFRIPSGNMRGRINIALMEAVFNCFWERSEEKMSDKKAILKRFDEMLGDREFLESFRSSTGSKSGVRLRFEKAHKYLDYFLDYD